MFTTTCKYLILQFEFAWLSVHQWLISAGDIITPVGGTKEILEISWKFLKFVFESFLQNTDSFRSVSWALFMWVNHRIIHSSDSFSNTDSFSDKKNVVCRLPCRLEGPGRFCLVFFGTLFGSKMCLRWKLLFSSCLLNCWKHYHSQAWKVASSINMSCLFFYLGVCITSVQGHFK